MTHRIPEPRLFLGLRAMLAGLEKFESGGVYSLANHAKNMDRMAIHQPHLENFFDAIQGKARLNCPAEVGFASAVTVLKVNEAVAAEKKLAFISEDFAA